MSPPFKTIFFLLLPSLLTPFHLLSLPLLYLTQCSHHFVSIHLQSLLLSPPICHWPCLTYIHLSLASFNLTHFPHLSLLSFSSLLPQPEGGGPRRMPSVHFLLHRPAEFLRQFVSAQCYQSGCLQGKYRSTKPGFTFTQFPCTCIVSRSCLLVLSIDTLGFAFSTPSLHPPANVLLRASAASPKVT